MMKTRDMPAHQMNYLRMLQEVSLPDLDLVEMEKLVKAEASVCYRLLRYLNSAILGFQSEIHSVRHALSILGERDVRRWVWVRIRLAIWCYRPWCEGGLGNCWRREYNTANRICFLLGLLSLIDAMLEMPMEEVLEKIPLDHATKAVLLGQASVRGPVFRLGGARERGLDGRGAIERYGAELRRRGGRLLASAAVGARGFKWE